MGLVGSGPRSGAGTVHGSRQVGPDITSKAARRSATRRAIGPSTIMSWAPTGASGSRLAAVGMRPRVGLSTQMPQHWAGQRRDPSPSLPTPNGVMPVASAAASPPLEAPGVRDLSQGLMVAPHSSLTQCQRTAMVARLVWPIGIAPAARRRSTWGASPTGYASASALSPCVVGVPARSMFPLTVKGTPWSGGRSPPPATARSAALAASSACSPRRIVMALMEGFTASIRRRWDSMTS